MLFIPNVPANIYEPDDIVIENDSENAETVVSLSSRDMVMLQSAFDDILPHSDLERIAEFSELYHKMELSFAPVFYVLDDIVRNIDVDSLLNNDIILDDLFHHYFLENIMVMIQTCGELVFTTVSYSANLSVIFGTEPQPPMRAYPIEGVMARDFDDMVRTLDAHAVSLDEMPFSRSSPYNRLRTTLTRVYDLVHGSVAIGQVGAAWMYFIRIDGAIFANSNFTPRLDRWDSRLLLGANFQSGSVFSNGTRTPQAWVTIKIFRLGANGNTVMNMYVSITRW